MAAESPAMARMRCLECGQVDRVAKVPGGPGWLALALWAGSFAAWAASWYWVAFHWLFLALLLAALLYTLWYFFQREKACRHCGARRLEPHREPPG